MKVGWLGLGKLGLPCAAAIAAHPDHQVLGYDPAAQPWTRGRFEPGVDELLDELGPDDFVGFDDVRHVVADADLIFVAVQTPHAADYDGSSPMPDERRDFSYTALRQACRQVAGAAARMMRPTTLVVVSTVLPGTMAREIQPLLGPGIDLVYNPFFIAMGQVLDDFRHPEFVLVGADQPEPAERLEALYATLHDRPVYRCSIASAELAKVAYNTAISSKIVLANTLMEICHRTAADVDEVTGALELATDRVASGKYLRGGMGDGGACHPRDLIAMSWLAEHLDLSFDLYGALVRGREYQTSWLAELALEQAEIAGLDEIVVLGRAYKAESNMTAGSPALLLAHYLEEAIGGKVTVFDPYVDEIWPALGVGTTGGAAYGNRALYVVATRHEQFARWTFEAGSVVVDPWRYIPAQPGVTVIGVGGA